MSRRKRVQVTETVDEEFESIVGLPSNGFPADAERETQNGPKITTTVADWQVRLECFRHAALIPECADYLALAKQIYEWVGSSSLRVTRKG